MTWSGREPPIKRTQTGEPVWPKLPHEMGQVLAADLESAGLAVTDEEGRVADFHALRHTFVTRPASSGVPPKIAQTLARHSTIKMTMDRYAHVERGELTNALESLKPIGRTEDRDAEAADRPGQPQLPDRQPPRQNSFHEIHGLRTDRVGRPAELTAPRAAWKDVACGCLSSVVARAARVLRQRRTWIR